MQKLPETVKKGDAVKICFYLHVSAHHMYAGASRGQKSVSDALEAIITGIHKPPSVCAEI